MLLCRHTLVVWDWERGVAVGTALAHGEGAVLGCAFVPGTDDDQVRGQVAGYVTGYVTRYVAFVPGAGSEQATLTERERERERGREREGEKERERGRERERERKRASERDR